MSKNTLKTEILSAAIELAQSQGLNEVSREQIAALAKCSTGAVNLHFGTMQNLRRAIVGESIRIRNLNIIAQALVMGDPRARRAPDELKREALQSVMG
jgi:AcrR family transcriptional regulator